MKTSSLQSKRRGHYYDSIRETNGQVYPLFYIFLSSDNSGQTILRSVMCVPSGRNRRGPHSKSVLEIKNKKEENKIEPYIIYND